MWMLERLRMMEELSRIDIAMCEHWFDAFRPDPIRSPIINCLTRAEINRRKND